MRVTKEMAGNFYLGDRSHTSLTTCQFLGRDTAECGSVLYMTAHNFIDETGNRYGKLLVVRKVPSKYWGQAQWLCRCDCGNEIALPGASLRKRATKSCGCFRIERILETRRLPWGQAAFKALLRSTRSGAKARGLEWKLTKEQFRQLTKQQCHYCDSEPAQVYKSPSSNGDYIYNGLDRVDNDKGYTTDNIVPCCGACNYAKRTMTTTEFADWVTRVYEHFI